MPDPAPPGAAPGQWWPPQALTPAWIDAHAARVDLVHVHFGLESLDEGVLDAALTALRRQGLPLVHTVHDLENPQLEDQAAHARALDAVIPAADALVTLTPGAAAAVRERWGRTCTVLAHPTLLPEDAVVPVGRASPALRVGVHLRDLRPNIDAVGVVATLVRTIAGLRASGTRAQAVIRMNARVRDEALARAVADLADVHDAVSLERGPRQDDDALAAWLADLDVCVLPYRHGTHSGWAEQCYDLAVPVASPRVGFVAEQHAGAVHTFDIGEPSSLARAVLAASEPGWSAPGSAARRAEVARRRGERLGERRRVQDAHARIYQDVLRMRGAA
jgi:hypothetical protein